MSSKQYIKVEHDGYIETEKAIGVHWDDMDDSPIWFPKQFTGEVNNKTIEIEEWIFDQKMDEYE